MKDTTYLRAFMRSSPVQERQTLIARGLRRCSLDLCQVTLTACNCHEQRNWWMHWCSSSAIVINPMMPATSVARKVTGTESVQSWMETRGLTPRTSQPGTILDVVIKRKAIQGAGLRPRTEKTRSSTSMGRSSTGARSATGGLRTRSELVWIQSHETQTRWWKLCTTYPRSAPSRHAACFQDRWPKTKPSTTCATWACLGTGMWRFMCHNHPCERPKAEWLDLLIGLLLSFWNWRWHSKFQLPSTRPSV